MAPFKSREYYVTNFIRPIKTAANGATTAEVARFRQGRKDVITQVSAVDGYFDFSAVWQGIPLHTPYVVLFDEQQVFTLQRRPAFAQAQRITVTDIQNRIPSALEFLEHGFVVGI